MKLTVRNKTQHSIKDQNKFTFPGVDGSTEKKISIHLKRGDPNFGQSSHREIHEQSSTRRAIEFTAFTIGSGIQLHLGLEFSISGSHTLNSTRFSVRGSEFRQWRCNYHAFSSHISFLKSDYQCSAVPCVFCPIWEGGLELQKLTKADQLSWLEISDLIPTGVLQERKKPTTIEI